MSTDNTSVLIDDESELQFGADTSVTIDSSKYVKDTTPESSIHYNLRTLSYSGRLTLHSCPRKFQLNRLMPKSYDPDVDEDENGHLDFGTVVGNGIQELLTSRDMNKAMFRAFLDWKDNLESERGIKSSKTFWHALQAIQKFTELVNGPLSQYELARFEERPATELGFSIDCFDGFRYRGKLDGLLIHKHKREFLPLECKTTGWNYLDEAMYGNSSQGIGYGIVIDRVAHESEIEFSGYDIAYPVYMTKKTEWVLFRFPKGNNQRALFLQDLLLDINAIKQYCDLGYFPTRGESCFSYGRQCRHYGVCGMEDEKLIGDMNKIPIRLDKVGEFPLKFSIQELVEAQIEKQK